MATRLQVIETPAFEQARVEPIRTPVAHERRTGCRFHTVMRVARVSRTGDAGLWRVRNISDEGMMLMTSVPVTVGERLIIALSESVTLHGRAAWWDDGRCGVQLDTPIDCVALLKNLVEEQKGAHSRAPRLPVDARALLYAERGLSPVQLTNVSQHGAGFCHDGSIKAGMTAKLVLAGGGEHRGIVRWSLDGRAGMQLLEPLPVAALESAARL